MSSKIQDLPVTAETELSAKPKKAERNMGIELFRVVSMILVVWLHLLGHGGVLSATPSMSVNYKVALFLNVIVYCSVNCYALISGYTNTKTTFKFRRFIYLWLETMVLITALNVFMYFCVPSVTVTKEWWIAGLFPLIKRELWYFCAYFLMYPLIPVLNKGLQSLEKWQHILLIFSMQLVTVFRLLVHKDNFALSSGYSAMWLICLYVIGAYFRIYGAPKWAKPWVTLPAFFLAAGVAFARRIIPEIKFAAGELDKTSIWYEERDILISYISPCMVIMGVMLLLFFMQVKIRFKPTKWIISNLGKATWGVFVLHVCSPGWYYTNFWSGFRAFGTYNTGKMLLALLGAGLAMYLFLSLISIGRIYLFKLLRVNKLVEWLADRPAKIRDAWQKKKTDAETPTAES